MPNQRKKPWTVTGKSLSRVLELSVVLLWPLQKRAFQTQQKVIKKEKSTEISRFQCFFGGDKRDRTADLLNAIQALSQLSYTPIFCQFSLPTCLIYRNMRQMSSTIFSKFELFCKKRYGLLTIPLLLSFFTSWPRCLPCTWQQPCRSGQTVQWRWAEPSDS